MDCPSADPNTRTEVDLMILDYILCTTISGLLSTREAESLAWALDTIDSFLLTFQDTESLPDDLGTKAQILDFMSNFLSYAWPTSQTPSPTETWPPAGHWRVHPKQASAHHRGIPAPLLSEIVTQFILLCNNAPTQTHHEKPRRITARLIMQAALAETPGPHSRSPGSFGDQLLQAIQNLCAVLTRNLGIDMEIYFSPPMGVSLPAQVEMFSREMPLPRLQDAIVDFMSNLIEGLEAPVLVQLERGQLHGLSRVETQQLKDRVGFR